jgi:hypothetical protein
VASIASRAAKTDTEEIPMKSRILAQLPIALAVTGLIAASAMLPSSTFAATERSKVNAMNKLSGRTFDYDVAGYSIRMNFLTEDRLRWTYLKAPDGQQGKTAEEDVDRRDIHHGIVLLSWTEEDGTSVVDIFDLQTMTLHANGVLPDGQRFFTQTKIVEVK